MNLQRRSVFSILVVLVSVSNMPFAAAHGVSSLPQKPSELTGESCVKNGTDEVSEEPLVTDALPAGLSLQATGFLLQAPAHLVNGLAANPLETQSRLAHARSLLAKSPEEFKKLQLKAARLERQNAILCGLGVSGCALVPAGHGMYCPNEKFFRVKCHCFLDFFVMPFRGGQFALTYQGHLTLLDRVSLNARYSFVNPLFGVWYAAKLPLIIRRERMHRLFAAHASQLFVYINSPAFLKVHRIKSVAELVQKMIRAEKQSFIAALSGVAAHLALMVGIAAARHNAQYESSSAGAAMMASWLLYPAVVKPLAKKIAARDLPIGQVEQDLRRQCSEPQQVKKKT